MIEMLQNHLPSRTSYSEERLSFFPPRGALTAHEYESRYIKTTSKEAQFLIFLSAYGSKGVSLRDLIMLGTLRQSGGRSKNHWLENGEVGSLPEVTDTYNESRENSSFLNCLMDAMSSSSEIEYLQTILEDLGLISVDYRKGGPSDTACQYWYIDERIWTIRSWDLQLPIDFGDGNTVRVLLDVFMGMPDKDVSPIAQRQREVYYYHAHHHMRQVMQRRTLLIDEDFLLPQAIFVLLQLLTHRYNECDAKLLTFFMESSIRVSHLRESVMLLWVELKKSASMVDSNGLCKVRDRLLTLSRQDSYTVPLQNGLVGFLLVDLMRTAKAANFEDIARDAVKLGTEWVDRTSTMKSTLERTALCEALAVFNVHDRKEAIPKEYHLFYGYNLARTGHLIQGDRFLASGLERYNPTLSWSYEFERVSIALRLGQRNLAAEKLGSFRLFAIHKRDIDRYSSLWKRSGECAEFFLLLNLYEADCCASAGRLEKACAKLDAGIKITVSAYDTYIRTLCVTLKMRLLEVRMWQQKLKEALPVALDLAREVIDDEMHSNFAPDTTYSITLQLLKLSSTVLSFGDVAESLELLESVKSIGEHLPSMLSEELESYVQQRMAQARRLCETTQFARQESNRRAPDARQENAITQAPTHLEQDPAKSVSTHDSTQASEIKASKLNNMPRSSRIGRLAGRKKHRATTFTQSNRLALGKLP